MSEELKKGKFAAFAERNGIRMQQAANAEGYSEWDLLRDILAESHEQEELTGFLVVPHPALYRV